MIPCKQKQWRASKIWEFSVFRVNFQGQISTQSSRKQFSFMNIKLGEQLLLSTFSILIIFEKLYLVNLCPIFVRSFQNLSNSWQKNEYTGLISDKRRSFSWMRNLLLQSWMDSNEYCTPNTLNQWAFWCKSLLVLNSIIYTNLEIYIFSDQTDVDLAPNS